MKEISAVPIKRKSNFELFRIFTMLMIIAHHYVVNSGLTSLYDYNSISKGMVYLQFLGFGGKIGINCFVLLTGYFQCKGSFKAKKLLQLVFECMFYGAVIYSLFCVFGVQKFDLYQLYRSTFYFIYSASKGFIGTYIILYVLTPFINRMISQLSQNGFHLLLGILLFLYTIISTFTVVDTWSYLGWLITIYLTGAYIRVYGLPWLDTLKRAINYWRSSVPLDSF